MHTAEEVPIVHCHLVCQIFGAHQFKSSHCSNSWALLLWQGRLWIIMQKCIGISQQTCWVLSGLWGKRMLERLQEYLETDSTPRRKMPLLLMLTCFCAIFIVIIITLINSTDWKMWTMANKIQWRLTHGSSLLHGPGSSQGMIPFPWQTCKRFLRTFFSYFPLKPLQSRYWHGGFECLATVLLTIAGAGDSGKVAACPFLITHCLGY